MTPTKTIDAIKDPDDNRILECALEAGPEFTVTSDKDSLRLGKYGGIRIVTAGQLLEPHRCARIESGGSRYLWSEDAVTTADSVATRVSRVPYPIVPA